MELDPLVDVEARRSDPSIPKSSWRWTTSLGLLGLGSVLVIIFYMCGQRLHLTAVRLAGLRRDYAPSQIWVSPHVTRTLVGSAPKGGVVVTVDNIAHAHESTLKQFQNLTRWPPAKLLNAGRDCWQPCGNVSGDCAWCGLGNACCRFNAENDPDECTGVTFTVKDRHTCVSPVAYHALKHAKQDCLGPCQKSGYCEWCGTGHSCCMESATSIEAPECRGAFGFHSHNRYECVATLGSCGFMEAAGPDYPQIFNQTGSLGSLGGVMWYLHNHVITQCPRRYGIDRIRRYFVTVKSTDALFAATANMFDRYSDFDNGEAQESWSRSHWTKYGYNPGCLHVDPEKSRAAYHDAVWYSLPGRCPSRDLYSTTAKCLRDEPGGHCDAPNGTSTCTWHAQFAGEVFLDELAGITDHATFCTSGNYEFDLETDAGIGNNFWNDKLSAADCNNRMKRVYELFEERYPSMPHALNRHPCDADVS